MFCVTQNGTHLVNLVSDKHLDEVVFGGERLQLVEPHLQLAERTLAAHVVHCTVRDTCIKICGGVFYFLIKHWCGTRCIKTKEEDRCLKYYKICVLCVCDLL